MDAHEWHFALTGDDFDLSGIAGLFSDEAKIVKDETGRTELVMDLPFTPDESQAARDAGEELLAKLNAIVQVVHGNHENVRIGGVGCKDPSGGPMHLFIQVASSIRSRSRVSASLTVTGGASSSVTAPPKTIGDRMLAAADKNDGLDRALYLFGSLPLDWRGLYVVLEAAEDAHGGESGLIAKNWAPDGQIKAFKATANSYKALRLQARHGSLKTGVDRPQQTLTEARDMVRTIIEKWCKANI
jgi:hypothetical protein